MDASLTIVRRPIKHARLRVREDSSVQLTIPNCFDQALIDSLLQKKAMWIARHQQFFRDRKSARSALAPGEILFFGELFRYIPSPQLRHEVVIDEVTKQIRSGRDLAQNTEVTRWYRAYAKAFLPPRITELSAAHNLPYKRLFIRSQRTKWGTCSTQGNISLNWRLILAPKHVVDYVILHELIHTRVMNHSHGFWVLLKAICPQCEEAIRWLNSNTPLD